MSVHQEEHLDKQDFVHYTTKLVTFGLTWTLEDMSTLCGDAVTGYPVIKSEQFKSSSSPKQITDSKKGPVTFELWLYPKGSNAQNGGFIGLFINMPATDNSTDTLPYKFWVSIVDAKGDKVSLFSGCTLFQLPDKASWGSPEAIRRTDLFDPAKGFLHDSDKMVIHAKVGIYKCIRDDDPKPVATPTLTEQPQLVDKLNQGKVSYWDKSIAELLDSGAQSDVTLVMVDDGGQELRAHKWILAARSRVFADMFAYSGAHGSWWRPAKSINRVEIAKTRVEVFKQALHFIYTGKVERISLDGIAKDLMICADKYQLDPLKSICVEYLVASSAITTESDLSDLLALSILPESPKLHAKVLDLLRKKFETQLQNADKMKQLNRFLTNLATD